MEKEYLDHVESVAEELAMNGIPAIVKNGKITCDTIAGTLNYTCSEKTLMAEYYRFISHYGNKLYTWGLENKIKEYSKAITTPKD